MKLSIKIIATVAFGLMLYSICFGSEGTGTADFCERHGCGAPSDPGSVTPCPDLTCPDVTCQATDCSKTTVVVNPTPVTCPSLATTPAPWYFPCRMNADGTPTCPRKRTPHRAFIPSPDAEKYGAPKY
jgi:hypothetical protein